MKGLLFKFVLALAPVVVFSSANNWNTLIEAANGGYDDASALENALHAFKYAEIRDLVRIVGGGKENPVPGGLGPSIRKFLDSVKTVSRDFDLVELFDEKEELDIFKVLVSLVFRSDPGRMKKAIELLKADLPQSRDDSALNEGLDEATPLMDIIIVNLAQRCMETEAAQDKVCARLTDRVFQNTATEAISLFVLLRAADTLSEQVDDCLSGGGRRTAVCKRVKTALGPDSENGTDSQEERVSSILSDERDALIEVSFGINRQVARGKLDLVFVENKSVAEILGMMQIYKRSAWFSPHSSKKSRHPRAISLTEFLKDLRLREFTNQIISEMLVSVLHDANGDETSAEQLLLEKIHSFAFTFDDGSIFFLLDEKKGIQDILAFQIAKLLAHNKPKLANILMNLKSSISYVDSASGLEVRPFTSDELRSLESRNALVILAQKNFAADRIKMAIAAVSGTDDPLAENLDGDVEKIALELLKDLPYKAYICLTENLPCDELFAEVTHNSYTEAIALHVLLSIDLDEEQWRMGLLEKAFKVKLSSSATQVDPLSGKSVGELFALITRLKARAQKDSTDHTLKLPQLVEQLACLQAQVRVEDLSQPRNLNSFTGALKTGQRLVVEPFTCALGEKTRNPTRERFLEQLGQVMNDSPFSVFLKYLEEANDEKRKGLFREHEFLVASKDFSDESKLVQAVLIYEETGAAVREMVNKVGKPGWPSAENVISAMSRKIVELLKQCVPDRDFDLEKPACKRLRKIAKSNFIASISLLLALKPEQCKFFYNVFTDESIGAMFPSQEYKDILETSCPALNKLSASALFAIFRAAFQAGKTPFETFNSKSPIGPVLIPGKDVEASLITKYFADSATRMFGEILERVRKCKNDAKECRTMREMVTRNTFTEAISLFQLLRSEPAAEREAWITTAFDIPKSELPLKGLEDLAKVGLRELYIGMQSANNIPTISMIGLYDSLASFIGRFPSAFVAALPHEGDAHLTFDEVEKVFDYLSTDQGEEAITKMSKALMSTDNGEDFQCSKRLENLVENLKRLAAKGLGFVFVDIGKVLVELGALEFLMKEPLTREEAHAAAQVMQTGKYEKCSADNKCRERAISLVEIGIERRGPSCSEKECDFLRSLVSKSSFTQAAALVFLAKHPADAILAETLFGVKSQATDDDVLLGLDVFKGEEVADLANKITEFKEVKSKSFELAGFLDFFYTKTDPVSKSYKSLVIKVKKALEKSLDGDAAAYTTLLEGLDNLHNYWRESRVTDSFENLLKEFGNAYTAENAPNTFSLLRRMESAVEGLDSESRKKLLLYNGLGVAARGHFSSTVIRSALSALEDRNLETVSAQVLDVARAIWGKEFLKRVERCKKGSVKSCAKLGNHIAKKSVKTAIALFELARLMKPLGQKVLNEMFSAEIKDSEFSKVVNLSLEQVFASVKGSTEPIKGLIQAL